MTLHTLSIKELSDKLNDGSLSAVELSKHYIQRIKKHNSKLNCLLHLDEDSVLKNANQAQQQIDSGNHTPLTGIPLSHKDIFCTSNAPTTCGSKMLEGFIPPYNATIIDKLNVHEVSILVVRSGIAAVLLADAVPDRGK